MIALMLARAVEPGGKVVAVEAQPFDFATAEQNARRNAANLRVVHAAVAREPGWVDFGLDGRVEAGNGRCSRSRVAAVSIDQLAAEHGVPDVVFMDIEGFEAEALAGAAATLRSRVDWFVEVHSEADLARFGADRESVLRHFPSSRYELWIAPDALRITPEGRLVEQTTFRRLASPMDMPAGRFLVALESR